MAIDFGSDYSTFRDDGTYGLTYVRITGARVPLEGVARSWMTEPGDLFWAPNFGFNLLRLENAGRRLTLLPSYEQMLSRAAKRVNFVYRADVSLSYKAGTLTALGRITLADGQVYPLLVTAANAAAAVVQLPVSQLMAA